MRKVKIIGRGGGAMFEDGELIVKEGDNISISKAEETGGTEEIRGERDWRRGKRREGINNDHKEREANRRRCNNKSQRKRERGKKSRVLMKDDIIRSYITTSVKKVHLVALLCARVTNKYAFKSVRGEFGEEEE